MDGFHHPIWIKLCYGESACTLHPNYARQMTGSMAFSPEKLTGYRLEQLAAAFDRVRNMRDWEAPILAVIPSRERPVVEKAVLWFTNTAPVFVPVDGAPDELVVRAPGYRLGSAL
jgi:hypothetical protein